jgi:hypothetical protein
MASPRFNDGFRRRAISRSASSSPRWIRAPELGTIDGSVGPEKRRIFALVSPPIPAGIKGKTIRAILVFDDHPDTLRLLSASDGDLDAGAAASGRGRRTSIICGTILIAIVVAGMLWPLLW